MTTRQNEYLDKLRDPRWQKKRLEIFQRDGFACVVCSETKKELQVHHEKYEGEPREGSDENKKTMCKDCHKRQRLTKQLMELIDDYLNDIDHDSFKIQVELLAKRLGTMANHIRGYER